jgi:Ca2+-binding EF-hand superfamily protein
LDTDHDGFITFNQYSTFIRKYLGNDIDLSSSKYSPVVGGVSEEERKFVQAIWDELKKYFDKYDTKSKGYLVESELKAFVVEILQETTERELNYVFWNLFRVDSNANKEVDFVEFVKNNICRHHSSSITPEKSHFNDSTASRPKERAL